MSLEISRSPIYFACIKHNLEERGMVMEKMNPEYGFHAAGAQIYCHLPQSAIEELQQTTDCRVTIIRQKIFGNN